jgi:hypothetical protein
LNPTKTLNLAEPRDHRIAFRAEPKKITPNIENSLPTARRVVMSNLSEAGVFHVVSSL